LQAIDLPFDIMWQLKNEPCAAAGTGLASSKYSIFSHSKKSWWADYTEIQDPKSKKEIHRCETLCDRRDPRFIGCHQGGNSNVDKNCTPLAS
jgi:hypothetical protein